MQCGQSRLLRTSLGRRWRPHGGAQSGRGRRRLSTTSWPRCGADCGGGGRGRGGSAAPLGGEAPGRRAGLRLPCSAPGHRPLSWSPAPGGSHYGACADAASPRPLPTDRSKLPIVPRESGFDNKLGRLDAGCLCRGGTAAPGRSASLGSGHGLAGCHAAASGRVGRAERPGEVRSRALRGLRDSAVRTLQVGPSPGPGM